MSNRQATLFPSPPCESKGPNVAAVPSSAVSRRTYINNLLVNESLQHLPAALDHPSTDDFKAYLREHLHHNSANTRLKCAEYIAYRYSQQGKVNLALARFLKCCPDENSRREVLWFEMLRAVPPLQELSSAWLSKIPAQGTTREELLEFMRLRVGNRNPGKLATEALGAMKKLGHLKSDKPKHYYAIWTDPSVEVLIYALAQIYPTPTAVRMEVFKTDSMWQGLLWPPASLERIILQGDRFGKIANVTQLDTYYQFTLQGSGEERLQRLLARWTKGGKSHG
ncbi:MAG: hypothetical protein PHV34_14795 [Verrucomicrobiae bacterium]|nr:hypothetical protein [Verrucomicrobiae bacterium]